MATRVYINVDVEPFCTELVFPKGVDVGGFVSLVFGPFVHGNTSNPNSKSGRSISLAWGTKKGRPEPVSKKVFIQASYGERNPLCTLREAPLPDLDDIPDESEDEAVDDPIYGASAPNDRSADLSLNANKPTSPSKQSSSEKNKDGNKENEGNTCPSCGGWFPSYDIMLHHRALAHSRTVQKTQDKEPKTLYGCKECKQIFPSSAECLLHKWKHKPESEWPFQCNTCNRGFIKKHIFQRHQESHKKKEEQQNKDAPLKVVSTRDTFLCVHCEQLFLSQAGLARHISKYHKKKPAEEQLDPETAPERAAQANAGVVTIQCDHCTFGCNDNEELASHIMTAHPNIEVFRCEDCSKPFLTKDDLDTHKAVKHVPLSVTPTADGYYVCHICDRKLQSFGGYWNHLRGHSKAKPFLCNHCGNRYVSRGSLTKHMRTHDFANAVKCPHCTKEFATLDYLKIHERLVHIRDFKYPCRICGHKFPTERKQQTHMAVVHEQELTPEELSAMKRVQEHRCCHCPFKTYSSLQFRRHTASHTGNYPFVCAQCGRGFAFRYQLTLHTRKNHRPGGPLKCPTCPRVFAAEDVHAAHVALHASSLSLELTCKDCGRLFETPRLLDRHRSAMHSTSNRYKCTECARSYSVPSALASHIRRMHKGGDVLSTAPHWSASAAAVMRQRWPYPQKEGWKFCCETCQRFFKFESSLRAHRICYHTEGAGKPGEQKMCPECGKMFQNGIHLSLHIRTHTREQSFKCTFCAKAYQNRCNLKKHMAMAHRSCLRCFCPQCDLGFMSQASLLLHTKYAHKKKKNDEQQQRDAAAEQQEQAQVTEHPAAMDVSGGQAEPVPTVMNPEEEIVDDPQYDISSAQQVLQLLSNVSQVEEVVSETVNVKSGSAPA